MRLAERTLLLVEDDPQTREHLCLLLEGEFACLYRATDGEEGIGLYRRHRPDLVLSDVRMPGMDGLEMARRIRREDPEQTILFLSAHDDREILLAALDVAAAGFISKPILAIDQLMEPLERAAASLRNREARRAHLENLFHAAHHDPLTGVPNRRYFLTRLEAMMEEGTPLALLFIDLDDLKSINDHHGHASGDYALQTFARRLRDLLPRGGQLARIGGDEFAMLLPGRWEDAALIALNGRILERCRRPFSLPDGEAITTGCSIGASRYPRDTRTLDRLIDLADRAMYRSKRNGKGTYTLHGSEEEDSGD